MDNKDSTFIELPMSESTKDVLRLLSRQRIYYYKILEVYNGNLKLLELEQMLNEGWIIDRNIQWDLAHTMIFILKKLKNEIQSK